MKTNMRSAAGQMIRCLIPMLVVLVLALPAQSRAGTALLPPPFGPDPEWFRSEGIIPGLGPPAMPPSAGSGSRLHQILGYGTLLLAAVAAGTGSDSPLHHYAGLGAGTLALATAAGGYAHYGDMFDPDEGVTGPNLHIALGTLGAVALAAEAVIAATDHRHGLLGMGSALALGAAVVVIKW